MSFGLIGNKIGMTRIFDNNGNSIPVTIIKSEPSCIIQIKELKNQKKKNNTIRLYAYSL